MSSRHGIFESARPIQWPNGKRFAFTVFDDTDRGTLDNLAPIYETLTDLGLRTTKSVWPTAGGGKPSIPGSTCDDLAYRRWVLELQARGFEIGFHNATYHGSTRGETIRALDRFRDLFGHDPHTAANHADNREAIYWGPDRLSGPRRSAYRLLQRLRRRRVFSGHVDGDAYFWGDVCRQRIQYVRNFVYRNVDTLEPCPMMPYHDPDRPYVNYWFASTAGGNHPAFIRAISEARQDELEARGGACIMYTHFGKGFCPHGTVDGRFQKLLERLAGKNGWFVPVHELLDFLRARNGVPHIDSATRSALENRWVTQQVSSLMGGLVQRATDGGTR